MNNLLDSWRCVLALIIRSWRSLLLAHFAFTALGVVLFVPLVGLTGRLLLKLSGRPVLADQDIAYFLLSPLGLIALTLFAALLITILAFEQAAIMRIALAAMQGKKLGALDALGYTAVRAHKLGLFTMRLVIRVLLLILPLMGLAVLIAKFLISDYDINFYLTETPPEFWAATVLIGLVLFLLLVVLLKKLTQWCLTLPLILFEHVSPAAAFGESAKFIQGHRKAVFWMLGSWIGISLLLGVVVLGLISLIGNWFLPAFTNSLSLTALLIGFLAAIWSVANILITAFTSSAFAFLIMDLYSHNSANVDAALAGTQDEASGKLPFRLAPKSLAGGVIAIVVIAGLGGIWLINGIPTNNEVIIAAHRGAAGKAPENTLASIQQAIDDQADWIEIDVQESADGDIVVIHDSDFMKLAGNPIKIWEATRIELDAIDIGSWFNSKFSAERVPDLEQVLRMAKGNANVVIELKYYGHDVDLERRVIDIVENMDMVDETAIMSLKYAAVQKVRKLRPDWTIGLLSATAIGDLSRLDTDFLAVAMSMASPGFIERAHRAGRQVFVWTVNDPISMSRMISLGVDGIITDEPEMAQRVLADREKMSTIQRLLLHATQLFGAAYVPWQYRDESP